MCVGDADGVVQPLVEKDGKVDWVDVTEEDDERELVIDTVGQVEGVLLVLGVNVNTGDVVGVAQGDADIVGDDETDNETRAERDTDTEPLSVTEPEGEFEIKGEGDVVDEIFADTDDEPLVRGDADALPHDDGLLEFFAEVDVDGDEEVDSVTGALADGEWVTDGEPEAEADPDFGGDAEGDPEFTTLADSVSVFVEVSVTVTVAVVVGLPEISGLAVAETELVPLAVIDGSMVEVVVTVNSADGVGERVVFADPVETAERVAMIEIEARGDDDAEEQPLGDFVATADCDLLGLPDELPEIDGDLVGVSDELAEWEVVALPLDVEFVVGEEVEVVLPLAIPVGEPLLVPEPEPVVNEDMEAVTDTDGLDVEDEQMVLVAE